MSVCTKEDIVYASLLLSLCLLCFRFVRLVRRVVVALLQQWFAQSLQHPSKAYYTLYLSPLALLKQLFPAVAISLARALAAIALH